VLLLAVKGADSAKQYEENVTLPSDSFDYVLIAAENSVAQTAYKVWVSCTKY
jgi:hypothetical protein